MKAKKSLKEKNLLQLLIIIMIAFMTPNTSFGQKPSVLLFTKTRAHRHNSIPVAIEEISKMCARNNWAITATEDSTYFDDYDQLKKYNLLLVVSTSGDVLNDSQQVNFEKYIAQGGGYVGVHAACNTEFDWPWYGNLVGAYFKDHPKQQMALIKKVNHSHPSVLHLRDTFSRWDEWYNYRKEVPQNVNVLLEVDESSYTGGMGGKTHPISWYHTFEGGRSFFTALGHTDESYREAAFMKHVEAGMAWAMKLKEVPLSKSWTNLLDKDLTLFDTYIGVPDASIDMKGMSKDSSGKYTDAIGINKDSFNIFTFEKEKNETVLSISGQVFGSITSKEEYRNYHLSLQVKWGDKRWPPRDSKIRDSGIIYHANGKHGAFWKVWMQGQECQIQEGDMGDYYGLAGAMADIPVVPSTVPFNNAKLPKYKMQCDFKSTKLEFHPSVVKTETNEKAFGQWNTVEVYMFGDKSIHVVNGKPVMVLYNSRHKIDDVDVPLTSGKIQIQSEGAQVYYKNIKIRAIDGFPKDIAKQVNLK
jgi:type 1 glutamine amidotransferase